MFLAGQGVFDGLNSSLANPRDPEARASLLTVDIEGDRGQEWIDQIWADGRKDLPVRPAMLTAVESDQRVALFLRDERLKNDQSFLRSRCRNS